MGLLKTARIVDRESDYAKRRLNRLISPARNDAIGMGDKTPDASTRTYADIMREQQFAREQDQTMRNIQRQKEVSVQGSSSKLARGQREREVFQRCCHDRTKPAL